MFKIFSYRFIFPLCLALTLIGASPAMSQNAKIKLEPDKGFLDGKIFVNQSLRKYMKSILGTLEQNGVQDSELTADYILVLTQQKIQDKQMNQLLGKAIYDLNLDGDITMEEVDEYIEIGLRRGRFSHYSSLKRIEKLKKELKRLDLDQDGIVSYKERGTISEHEINKVRASGTLRALWSYLSLDPNGDGVMTVHELETLAQNHFKSVDIDGDKIISSDELLTMKKRRKAVVPPSQPTKIKVPTHMQYYHRPPAEQVSEEYKRAIENTNKLRREMHNKKVKSE